jgi:16S rRNA (cytosine967-C5)-methyltransferase
VNPVAPVLWSWAAEVVAQWLERRQSPREAMAQLPVLRVADAGERAAVARFCAATLAGLRRLEFGLGGAAGLGHLSPRAHALALVLGHAVEQDLLLADGASRAFEQASREPVPEFARLLRLPALCAEQPGLAFARTWSLPDWFVPLAERQFGDDAAAVCASLAPPAPRTLRANLLRVASREQLAQELQAEGIGTRPAPFAATALHVLGEADLFASAAFRRGAFEQQDEASQLAVAVVAPPPGGKVLDLCAGSGGKTLALAALLQNRGSVLATDVHEGRLGELRTRQRRAGADNVQVAPLPERGELPAAVAAFGGHADRILVDAPCSGTGSWRRRPEARWTLDRRGLDELLAVQDRLLDRAAALLRPGARLVYATCSLLACENEQRIDALRQRRPELEPVRVAEILGGAVARPIADATGTFLSLRPDRHGTDGFFAAVLRRPRV